MPYQSTKTYGHNIGLSACFRQPNAHSHCKFLHGYSLQFKFTFQAGSLDERNWVVDFGGLKPLKAWLEETFDHKVVLDNQDPHLDDFQLLADKGLAEITLLDGVGVEMFAKHAYNYADKLVRDMTDNRCWVVSVECAEHGSNSAVYNA
jgi:6-pyruvoyltetrahydropterin/6-carboxytetrahydropterin synthase|tara:strand:- start:1136 stop:1579 length:444 start_codon:yes stop_codon:yes gene_type:complete